MALILAIDEDVVLTMSLDLQLGHVGHAVRRVSTVAQAKASFNEQTPDVIVIDPTVSDQDGWSLLELWGTTIPTIVMSHDPTDTTERRAVDLGCRVVLRKPLLVRELIDAITPLLPSPAPEHPQSTDVDAAPKTPRSTNPTAAERRAARERAKSTQPAPPTDTDQSTEKPQNADPLGLAANSDDDLLLAGLPTTAYTEPAAPDKKETLGMQMRAQRIKRNIPLNQVDLAIGVHMAYLQAMEEDRFSHLPRGRMAEEMITKYAKYLNLDVAAALLQYRSFQYSEPVEPITDFGAANLVVIRYAGFIRAVLGLLVLGGLSYGLWVYENDRLRAMYASVTTYVGGRTPTASIPTLTNADAAAGAQTATASATATPTTAQATQTTIPSSTPEPTARVTSTTAASATAEPTKTATNVPASATATTRATQTTKPSMTRSATRTSKPSATAQASATVRTTPSRTATATKKP